MVSKNQGIDDLTQFGMEVIRSAGEEALSFYGKGKNQVKFDEELVTKAELDLTEFFKNQLYRRFPGHQIFTNTQENKEYTHEGHRYVWVYDALDGVANFQAGIPIWGTSLALLENFWPIFGVFYMPVTGDLFYAQAGHNAFWGKEKAHVSAREDIDDESVLFTYSRFHTHYRSLFPGKIRNLGCTAAHICYVATGRAEGAVIANESYRDLAAARVIIEAAGGKIFKTDGGELFLDEYLDGRRIYDHLLVVAPNTYSQLRSYLLKNS